MSYQIFNNYHPAGPGCDIISFSISPSSACCFISFLNSTLSLNHFSNNTGIKPFLNSMQGVKFNKVGKTYKLPKRFPSNTVIKAMP